MLDVQDEVGLLLAAVVHTGREDAPAALFALGRDETGLAIRGGLDVREAKAIRNRVAARSHSPPVNAQRGPRADGLFGI